MRLLLDMNLSPQWAPYLRESGIEALHWSTIGDPAASDAALLAYAHEHHLVVLTHDLDFGAILASSGATSPSVVQMRVADITPLTSGQMLVGALREHEEVLARGALIVIDAQRLRVRVLPLHRN